MYKFNMYNLIFCPRDNKHETLGGDSDFSENISGILKDPIDSFKIK